MKRKLQNYKKVVSIVLAICLVIQVVLLSELDSMSKNLKSQPDTLVQLKANVATSFITDTVREQERKMLNSVRQGWVQYVQTHPNEDILQKDSQGHIMYGSNNSTTKLAFNPNTMSKTKLPNNSYDIINLSTGGKIATNVRPLWNVEVVKRILNIIATPVRAFGATGDVIIFDSFTGEMFIDNSEDCKDTPEVLGEDGKRYITLDYKHPNNLNPTVTQRVVNDEFMWRKDTDRNSGMVYFFAEKKDMGKDSNNFLKYPLGDYKREFQEKIILPYETVGVDGENMQITIVLGAQEQELIAPYTKVLSEYTSVINDLKTNSVKMAIFPYISIIVSFIVIFFCMFVISVYSFLLKKSNPVQKE